ncbi:MAG TPA: thiamine-phosphate kinase [Chthoniobacterales bacterium]
MTSPKLAGYGEDRLVRELTSSGGPGSESPALLVGPGDDCAVVDAGDPNFWQLLKTDAVVEGIHFTTDANPRDVGWKALCRAISDVAAMGGEPCFALVTLAVSPDQTVEWVRELYRGIRRAAKKYGVTLAGGETARSPGPAFISVALTGRVEKDRAILRSGAKEGDILLVTGRLGGSIRGWHLRFTPRVTEARWLAQHADIHAMMDLSDGLSADLPRLADASGLDYVLDLTAIPCNPDLGITAALNDGEDYELLLAVAPAELPALLEDWFLAFPKLPLTVIGRMAQQARKKTGGSDPTGGYHHF